VEDDKPDTILSQYLKPELMVDDTVQAIYKKITRGDTNRAFRKFINACDGVEYSYSESEDEDEDDTDPTTGRRRPGENSTSSEKAMYRPLVRLYRI
jgi:hypothetical protein